MAADQTALLLAATPLKNLVDDLYGLAKGRVKTKLKRLQTSKAINELYSKVSQVQKVKTIWQTEREVNLKKFYYPAKLVLTDDTVVKASSLKMIPYDGNFIIEGTVGQGKSILLRYLCSQEIRASNAIPVFAELRRISSQTRLQDFLIDRVRDLGINLDAELFEYFAGKGRITIFLDAFDEIREEDRTRLVTVVA